MHLDLLCTNGGIIQVPAGAKYTIEDAMFVVAYAATTTANSVEEFVKRVPEEYRRRWNIETGYRVKNEFKIKTCSKKGIARVLFFVVQCIMYNFLNVQKSVLSTTAHELKSLIAEDIQIVLFMLFRYEKWG